MTVTMRSQGMSIMPRKSLGFAPDSMHTVFSRQELHHIVPLVPHAQYSNILMEKHLQCTHHGASGFTNAR